MSVGTESESSDATALSGLSAASALSGLSSFEEGRLKLPCDECDDRAFSRLLRSIMNWIHTVKRAEDPDPQTVETSEMALMSAIAVYVSERRRRDLESSMAVWRNIRNGRTAVPGRTTSPRMDSPPALQLAFQLLEICEYSDSENDESDNEDLD